MGNFGRFFGGIGLDEIHFLRWERTVRAETDTSERFLPVTVIDQQHGQAVGPCCRIRVGEYITIDCDERIYSKSVERAITSSLKAYSLKK
jgi:hypothetical protein